MTTYYEQEKPVYKAPEPDYEYQEYEPIEEYKPVEYWTPAYENIEYKYAGKEYEAKQYLTEETKEVYEATEATDYVVGNQYDTEIATYDQNDIIEAGYGNDKIDAGAGDDWIWGISKAHKADDPKYAQEEYAEVDWYTGGAGKDIYALGTENYAHYATNGTKDYAIITDYTTADDTVMLHGTTENYVVGESVTKTEGEDIKESAATIYYDKDENGSYSAGDDMVAVFEGYSVEEITAAKDNWIYVQPDTPVV